MLLAPAQGGKGKHKRPHEGRNRRRFGNNVAHINRHGIAVERIAVDFGDLPVHIKVYIPAFKSGNKLLPVCLVERGLSREEVPKRVTFRNRAVHKYIKCAANCQRFIYVD